MTFSSLKSALLAATCALALAACGGGDNSTELGSPGTTGPNPGTGTGGSTGGGTGGGTGGSSAGNCPVGTTATTVGTATHCAISGTITADLELTSDNLYILDGIVTVGVDVGADGNATDGDPAILTIQPGTTIYGGQGDSVLVVARGSQLIADGTQANPIIFTSAQDLGFDDELRDNAGTTDIGLAARTQTANTPFDEPFTGEWGGLVIAGRAPINTCDFDANGPCESEAEATQELYGGSDVADNSGILRYVRVQYAGFRFNGEQELNGIGFFGVGNGTTVDFVQVHNNLDDGVEFFGGTVDAKHLFLSGNGDDNMDWTQGWTGRVQHVAIVQTPNVTFSEDPRGFEGDSNSNNPLFTPVAGPVVSNFTIVGRTDTAADIREGMLIRRGSGGLFYNGVVTGWPRACLDLDGSETFAQAGATVSTIGTELTVQSTLLACDDPTEDEAGDPYSLEDWFLNQSANNQIGGGATLQNNFINGTRENAITAVDPTTIDATFFDAAPYAGAVRSDSTTDNWTLGWTLGANAAPACPSTTIDNGNGGCIIEGRILEDTRLAAGLDYFLRGAVTIGQDVGFDGTAADGVSVDFTIDAGVTVQAESTESVLVVARGSRLFSNGTPTAPVRLTASNPDTRNVNTDTGLWGGLVIAGRAPINSCDFDANGPCEAQAEATQENYGGLDPDDDSGQIFYTRVEYAGFRFNGDQELNGIGFFGVGRGTEVDYVQVHNNLDDGVEFFGGTVDVKHLVITGAADDSFDWVQGYRGRAQHILTVQNPALASSFSEDPRGFEGDNNGNNPLFTPVSGPVVSHYTVVGRTDTAADVREGMLIRRGSGGRFYNGVVTGWPTACLDLDGTETFALAGATVNTVGTDLTLQSVLLDCMDATEEEAGDPYSLEDWFNNQSSNNVIGASSLTMPMGGGRVFVSGPNELAVSQFDADLLDSFFEPASSIGAVPADDNWTAGWTIWLDTVESAL